MNFPIKVGIIGAMEQEITILRHKLETNDTDTLVLAGCTIYIGKLNGIDVALLKSGIGKVSAALGTTLLLQLYKPDLIINTGFAGSLTSNLNIGDIVISNEVSYHDVDVTAFGYKIGQMAGNCPVAFKADHRLINALEKCINNLNINALRGLVVSGDVFINNPESLAYIRHIFPKAIAVDMESTSIGHVCYRFGIPFIIIRSISDIAGKESYINFKKSLTLLKIQYSLIVEAILEQLFSYFSINKTKC